MKFLPAIAICVALIGCGFANKPTVIDGKWKCDEEGSRGTIPHDAEFKPNGTFTMTSRHFLSGDFTVEGENVKLIITEMDGQSPSSANQPIYNLKLSDGNRTMTETVGEDQRPPLVWKKL